MRVRVPGRFIAVLAILTAFLCLLPVSTQVAVAKPIGWNDLGPPQPDSGDSDGVVLKAPSLRSYTGATGGSTADSYWTVRSANSRLTVLGRVWWYFTAMRLNFWLSQVR